MDRREFLRLGTGAAAVPALAGLTGQPAGASPVTRPPARDIEEVTIAELQERMTTAAG